MKFDMIIKTTSGAVISFLHREMVECEVFVCR